MTDTIPMVWVDDYSDSADDCCATCGKKLKSEKILFVEVGGGGDVVFRPDSKPDMNDGGYMGFFPVGPTCAKRHFEGYTHATAG